MILSYKIREVITKENLYNYLLITLIMSFIIFVFYKLTKLVKYIRSKKVKLTKEISTQTHPSIRDIPKFLKLRRNIINKENTNHNRISNFLY